LLAAKFVDPFELGVKNRSRPYDNNTQYQRCRCSMNDNPNGHSGNLQAGVFFVIPRL